MVVQQQVKMKIKNAKVLLDKVKNSGFI